MKTTFPKFTTPAEAARLVPDLGESFTLIHNPPGVFPPVELCPLAPKLTAMREGIEAVLLDMDGTLSSTEPLVIHALEIMLRKMTAREHDPAWKALDPAADFPHIVGNSNTKNVEYLVGKFQNQIQPHAVVRALIDVFCWNRAANQPHGDLARTISCIPSPLWNDERLLAANPAQQPDPGLLQDLAAEYAPDVPLHSPEALVSAGTNIYAHAYLAMLEPGPNVKSQPAVTAMPGVTTLLLMLRGLLAGDSSQSRAQALRNLIETEPSPHDLALFTSLCNYFARQVPKIAVVTSSTAHEANLVLNAVFQTVNAEARKLGLNTNHALRLLEHPNAYFTEIITASDSHEIRLKPHRDLYSIALQALGIGTDRAHRVLAIEDSEAGVTAIRAAGMGMAVAIPHEATANHDFTAAAHVCHNGLPEFILSRRCFLLDTLLGS